MIRRVVFVVLILLAVSGPMAPARADSTSDEAEFLMRINDLRASVGAQALAIDPQLTAVARGWSQQMADIGDISHNPDLRQQLTANRSKLGENVGMGASVGALFTAFVNSPHHYANLVDPAFNRVGIAVVWQAGTIYTTHDFVAARGGPSAAPPRPATVTTVRRATPMTQVKVTKPAPVRIPAIVPARPAAPTATTTTVTVIPPAVVKAQGVIRTGDLATPPSPLALGDAAFALVTLASIALYMTRHRPSPLALSGRGDSTVERP